MTRANSVPYGLSASVWTKDAQRSHDVASKLDAGTVWVNAHLVLANEVPWGGFKGSGYQERVARTVERTSSENPMRCCSAAIRAAGASPRTMASTTARWLRMCSSPASCSCRQ